MNTLEYLDEAKNRLGLPSDYALAKALKVSQPTISGYRAGRSRIDDDVALKLANLIGRDPLEVIATANIERAKTPEMKALWMGLLEKISKSFDTLMPRRSPRLA
ncbi:phage protein [Herbaspirillum seropedicae SmR1]|uniref:Phage protein n=1 Tax=Herbaspirillum seropedicae (strain SmR1) TaxID=757424 RepID=D8IVB6_HERSS|nr:helix-turn-helix domain-containing protein [Herbaspirillum seropedicae]ADJ63855.1 phage protein [Herbaspirillum seropedicae SmR1]